MNKRRTKPDFTEEIKKALQYERFNHPHPRVQLKMEVLWLKSQGLKHEEIARLSGIGVRTAGLYIREYMKGGIDALKTLRFHRRESDMAEHKNTIEAYFKEHPPATINEAAAKIEALTGLRRAPTQVRSFLRKNGMRRLKTGILPAKADAGKQADFKKKT